MPRVPMVVRFWRHVERTDACWWWKGARDGSGYGSFVTACVSYNDCLSFVTKQKWPNWTCARCPLARKAAAA